MIRGLYTAASGMTATMQETDVLANNLANLGTNGFKKVGVNYAAFGNVLMNKLGVGATAPIGSMTGGVSVAGTQTDFTAGVMKRTGNPLDVAIDGKGFFTVENPTTSEKFYTRNGAFTQNAQGVIVTQDGYAVMNAEGGPINVPPGTATINISNTGLVSDDTGQVLGQMKITEFSDPKTLETQGAYLYKAGPQTQISGENPESVTVVQGALEASNVNVVEELIRNIAGNRRYESLQKSIRMQDKSLEKAVNQVGRYR